MAEMIDRLTRFYCYAYRCKAESKNGERLWWNGYVEALQMIIELMKGELKK